MKRVLETTLLQEDTDSNRRQSRRIAQRKQQKMEDKPIENSINQEDAQNLGLLAFSFDNPSHQHSGPYNLPNWPVSTSSFGRGAPINPTFQYIEEVNELLDLKSLNRDFYAYSSAAGEAVNPIELKFMEEGIAKLDKCMTKLKEYFLLFPYQYSEIESIRRCEGKNVASSDLSPSSTLFYPKHSSEFLRFSRFWHYTNKYYASLHLDYHMTHGLNMNVQEKLAKSVEKECLERGLSKVGSEVFEAKTIEQAAYVAEQKAREVYGLYKLIVSERAQTKKEAALLMQSGGIYPAKRILIWAEEFYQNGGRFSRH